MTVTVCWAVKGGSGTTVVAAGLALARPGPQLLVDLDGELPAVLGLAEPSGQGLCDWFATDLAPSAVEELAVEVGQDARLIPRGADRISPDADRWADLVDWLATARHDVVVDAGTGTLAPALASRRAGVQLTLVTRACYLALRRAARCAVRPDAVVLVAEPGRSLGRGDVEQIVGAPVVTTISVDPHVARAVDAGLLVARLPQLLARELRRPPRRATGGPHRAAAAGP
jgi:hypothetical protein